jgi:hypothetical protein
MGFANGDTGARMIGAMLKAKAQVGFTQLIQVMRLKTQTYGKEFE